MATPQLTPLEIVRDRIESYDADYHDWLYRQVMYALGGDVKRAGLSGMHSSTGWDFPVYTDTLVRMLKIGESRRILNTQFIGLSRIMDAEPDPSFPQAPKYVSECRRQFYLTRHRQCGYGAEYADCYLDGEATGAGWLEVGMMRGKVSIQHCSSYNVIWDRLARSPDRARYVAFVRYIDRHKAKVEYGEAAAKQTVTMHGADSKPMECVRVVTYYDTGDITGTPSMYKFVGTLEKPHSATASPIEELPVGNFTYWTPPGMRKPMGRIHMQQAIAEAINEMESFYRKQMKQPSATMYDVNQIHPEDLKAIMSGRVPQYIRITKPSVTGYPALTRVPAAEFPVAAQQLLEMMERQFNVDSGTTEAERASFSKTARTLGENQLVDQRGQTQATWSARRSIAMYSQTIDRVLKVAAAVDRTPTYIDIRGRNVLINDPENPVMAFSRWMEEESAVVLSEQTLQRSDDSEKSAQRLAQLETVKELVGQTISPEWFTEEKLRAIGETDPEEAMIGLAGGANEPQNPIENPGMPEMGVPAV